MSKIVFLGSKTKRYSGTDYEYRLYLLGIPIIIKKDTVARKFLKLFGIPVYYKVARYSLGEYIFFSFIKLLQPLFPKDTYILTDNLYESSASCIDTYTLFEYLKKNGFRCYYVLWKSNPFYNKLKEQKQLKNVIITKRNSLQSNELIYKLFFPLLRAKYTILSFRNSFCSSLERFVYTNKYIYHVGIGHGPVLLKKSVLTTPYLSPRVWNLYLVSSDTEKSMFTKYGWPEKLLFNIGLPRFDCCRREPHKGKNIVIMFTWRLVSFREKNEEIKDSIYYKRFTSLLNNKELINWAKMEGYNIIISIHHAFRDLCNFEFDIDEYYTVADSSNLVQYINTADLFITDYSSIFHDFMFLNIPIIFYWLDYGDRWLSKLDYEDLENCRECSNLLFNIFYSEEEVISKIKYYIENDFQLENEYKLIENRFFTEKENLCEKFTSKLQHYYESAKIR